LREVLTDHTQIRMFFDMHEAPGTYRWRVKGPGNTTLEYSRICYQTRKSCLEDMQAIKARTYPQARIVDLTHYQEIPMTP
jgi:hypothetical protein